MADVTEQVMVAKAGLRAVLELMDSSFGVDGLHLNGDVAPWEQLRTGGQYEEWLLRFDQACELLEVDKTGLAD